jgi:hypothetical protein
MRVPALRRVRHFALVEGFAVPTQSPLAIVFKVRNSVRPVHLFGHNRDDDYYFELPREGERDAQSITLRSTAHRRDVGLSRVRTELRRLVRLIRIPARWSERTFRPGR